MTCADITF